MDIQAKYPRSSYVIGIDEVGTGAIAGPIVVGAVVFPITYMGHPLIKDSKAYSSEKSRLKAYEYVKEVAEHSLVLYGTVTELNRRGPRLVLPALQRQAASACLHLFPNSVVLVDGCNLIPKLDCVQESIVKGDKLVPAISAASVVAKVSRDDYMKNVYVNHYEFEKNKGYPTKKHLELLKSYGPGQEHRIYIKSVYESIRIR